MTTTLDTTIAQLEEVLDLLRRARGILAPPPEPAPEPVRAARAVRPPRALKAAPTPTPPAGKKRCGTCDQVKPLDQFNVNRAKADGLQTACRPCQRGQQAKSWSKRLAKSKAKDEEPEPVRAVVVKGSVRWRPTELQQVPAGPSRGSQRVVQAGRRRVAAERHMVRCRTCDALVWSTHAGLHLWEAHQIAVPAYEALGRFEAVAEQDQAPEVGL